MDYDSTSTEHAGENFFAPTKAPEQIQQETAARELGAAQMSIIEELIAEYQAIYDEHRSVDNLKTGTLIEMRADLLYYKKVTAFAKKKLEEYQSRYKSTQRMLATLPEEPAK